MVEIQIDIADKIPVVIGNVKCIVANNSDYTMRFTFDDQWDRSEKTAYFVLDNGWAYTPVKLNDDTVTLPRITGTTSKWLYVGVQQGERHTSHPCAVPICPSITDLIDDDAVQPHPALWEDVMSRLKNLEQFGSGSGGLTAVQIAALDAMFQAAAYAKSDVSAEYSAFKEAFGIGGNDEPDTPDTPSKTMVNITATYSGGDAPVGMDIADLIGITVTAYYSDGSTANVTDYTLSGEIAEGQNRITVSYNGFTTLIYVNGVVDAPAYGVSNETTWTNGVAYEYITVGDEHVDKTDGSFQPNGSGWERTPHLYCEGAEKLRFTLLEYTSMFGSGGNGVNNAFYDADKNFICSFHMGMTASNAEGDYVEVDVPKNAVYFACCHKGWIYSRYLSITPYGTGSSVEPDEPAKTMTALGATYSGGDAPVGMDIADLIGITVTVYYSDGSTANVTDYTMNGGIYNEGGNVITVFYNDFSTQFVVFGVANEPETGVSNETTWTNGVAYEYITVGDEHVEKSDGSFQPNTSGWERTPHLYCEGADKIRFTVLIATTMFGSGGNGVHNAFYDADKNFICSFHMTLTSSNVQGDYVEVDVPENAAYFACCHKGTVYSQKLSITPYGEVA